MNHPKSKIRNPNPVLSRNSETSAVRARSVLECGDPLRLLSPGELVRPAAPSEVRARSAARSPRFAGAWVWGNFPRRGAVDGARLRGQGCERGLLSRAWLVGLALWLSAFSFPLSAFSQSHAIPWWTVDNGGGTSTGGVFAVSGTIGQPDAGVMSGGNFTLVGGFWSVVAAVQTPGAPYLTVFRSATNTVVVSWPLAGAEGWVLQATNALWSGAASWPVIPPPYQTNGTNLQFIEPSPTGNKFFRLHKP